MAETDLHDGLAYLGDVTKRRIGLRRTDLTALAADLRAGRVSVDVVRAALPFCWMRYGSTLEAPEMLAMLRSVGPISDSPERPMPDRFPVYQGRPSGEALGIAWSPDPAIAAGYGTWWQAVRKYRGADLWPVLWTGTVRAADVLMLSRMTSEVIVPPEAVNDAHEIPARSAPAVDSDAWDLKWDDHLLEFEAQVAGFSRYLIRRDYPHLVDAMVEVRVQSDVRTFSDVLQAERKRLWEAHKSSMYAPEVIPNREARRHPARAPMPPQVGRQARSGR